MVVGLTYFLGTSGVTASGFAGAPQDKIIARGSDEILCWYCSGRLDLRQGSEARKFLPFLAGPRVRFKVLFWIVELLYTTNRNRGGILHQFFSTRADREDWKVGCWPSLLPPREQINKAQSLTDGSLSFLGFFHNEKQVRAKPIQFRRRATNLNDVLESRMNNLYRRLSVPRPFTTCIVSLI
jgi:hypothetical protein